MFGVSLKYTVGKTMHWLEKEVYRKKSSGNGLQDYETNWEHFSCLKISVGGEGYASNHIVTRSKTTCYLTGASLNKQGASSVVR